MNNSVPPPLPDPAPKMPTAAPTAPPPAAPPRAATQPPAIPKSVREPGSSSGAGKWIVGLVLIGTVGGLVALGIAKKGGLQVRATTRPQGRISGLQPNARPRSSPLTVSPRNRPTDPLVLKVLDAHDEKLELLMKEYSAASGALQEPPVLDFSAVSRPDQLKPRMELIRKYIAANERVMTFLVNDEQTQRETLDKLKLPAGTVEATLKAFRDQLEYTQDTQLKVRETDRRMGVALLGMLEVLEDNWGHWSYNPEKKKVDFDDPRLLDRYLHFRNQMDTAAQDQKKWQTRLETLLAG
jgi:hypothetical protein